MRLTAPVPVVAKVLDVGRGTGYAAAAAGEWPTVRVGKRVVVLLPRLAEQLGLSPEDLATAVDAEISAREEVAAAR